MLKYLTVALLAFAPALSAFGAAPAVEHSATAHSHITHPGKPVLTAAQRKARQERLEHARVVKRIAQEHRLQRRRGAAKRTTGARKTVAQREAARRQARRRAYARRMAAHRAYERHLAHERWLRRHRAYEARLKREREAKHRGYEHRLAARHAAVRKTGRMGRVRARKAKPAGSAVTAMELAKADVPKGGPRPLTGVMHSARLDYVSHAHVRLYWRSPLRGTHASLVRQDQRDREEGLTRIRDEAQLYELVRDHTLIPLPLNVDLQADPRLAHDRRYTRPWTAHFLQDLSRAYMRRFGEALVITSAVRPASYQRRLTWRNGNAAPANGEIASPHEYGATIDIGKKGMTAREKAWMRGYLYPIQKAGQIDVEEEFYQACFHVTVYTNYVPAPMARPQPEMAHERMEAGTR